MIFAAGLGTRLRPLTDHTPKALVSVAGKPMLERVILRLKEAGFNDITVNIHHFGEQIIGFLRANNNFGVTIHISDERDMLLDTGGGIKKARPFLDGDEPFLVHNADILSDISLADFTGITGRAMRKLHCSSAGGRHPVTCYWMTPTVCMAGLINPQAKPSPRGSLSGKADTRKWLSAVFTSYPLPFSAIWKGDNGKKSSPLSLLPVCLRNSPHTGLSASRPLLVRHRQTGNTG